MEDLFAKIKFKILSYLQNSGLISYLMKLDIHLTRLNVLKAILTRLNPFYVIFFLTNFNKSIIPNSYTVIT